MGPYEAEHIRSPQTQSSHVCHIPNIGGAFGRRIDNAIFGISLLVLQINDRLSGLRRFSSSAGEGMLGLMGFIPDDHWLATEPALNLCQSSLSGFGRRDERCIRTEDHALG